MVAAGTKNVVDTAKIGKKGFPRLPSLYGMQFPTKEVPIHGAGDPGTAAALPPTETDFSRAVEHMLDAKAQERQYDSINTAISYRDDPNAGFAAEGKALFDWRSAVWTYATAQLAAVKAGTRAQPSVADFVSEIEGKCQFSWPAEAAA